MTILYGLATDENAALLPMAFTDAGAAAEYVRKKGMTATVVPLPCDPDPDDPGAHRDALLAFLHGTTAPPAAAAAPARERIGYSVAARVGTRWRMATPGVTDARDRAVVDSRIVDALDEITVLLGGPIDEVQVVELAYADPPDPAIRSDRDPAGATDNGVSGQPGTQVPG